VIAECISEEGDEVMAIVTVGALLDKAEQFEQRLERYYAAIRDESEDNGVRLLTYYLSKHRRHLRRALSDLDTAKIRLIRRIELKYADDVDLEKGLHITKTPARDVKGEDLLESAVEHDAALVQLYKGMLRQSLIAEVHAFLEALIRVEERDIVMLKKMLAVHYF